MKTLPELLALSIKIAVNAHDGQFDKAGKPYILHPLRVMNACNSIECKILGILHDTVEDTDITLDQLDHDYYLPRNILYSLSLLTHDEDISYEDYILKIKDDDLAREVKVMDIRDNSDIFRLHEVEEKHIKLIRRYHWAMKQLRNDSKYLTSPR